MTPSEAPPVAWFVRTAGSAIAHEYRWLSVDPPVDPATASQVMKEEVAGRALRDLVPEDTPSTVLGKLSDGTHVLVAGGMRPAGAPAKGDYMHRPILATLLGVAPAGADPTPLLAAAAAALDGSLAGSLPVNWTNDGPATVPGAWAPRRASGVGGSPNMRETIAVPHGERVAVAAELAAVDADDLAVLPADRPLLLETDMLDRSDLTALRPWRAVTTVVAHRTPLAKEGDHLRPVPDVPRWIVYTGVAVVGGLALLAWFVVTRLLGRA